MDFTIKIYTKLLNVLNKQGYSFITFQDYILNKNLPHKFIILRHDVDLKPYKSLAFAKIQNKMGIKGTYFFRIVKKSWNNDIVLQIFKMGHEIGYHYENLSTAKGNIDNAYKDFCENLEKLRKLAPIKTICMHGSPSSPYDSKDIWVKYNYKI